MKMNKNTIVRHHLLEIILWPKDDGTFRTIHNSMELLKELGIYDDYKMTIPLTVSEHNSLHHSGKIISDEAKKKMSESHKGKSRKPFSAETRKKMSEAMKGIHKSKTWKLVNGKRVWIEKEKNHG